MVNKKKIGGFALMESMISMVVVAGYITSVQNAEIKKQLVSDAIDQSKSSQMAVMEYYKKNGILPTDSKQINLPVGNQAHGAEIKIGEFGEIIITMAQKDNIESIANKTIILEPNIKQGAIDWSCANGSLDNNYRPKNCYKNPMHNAETLEKLDSITEGNYI